MLLQFLALLTAGMLAVSPALSFRHKPHQPPTTSLTAVGPSLLQERALRRRVVRLARIKMLERRQAMLFEFLARAHSEAPLFDDQQIVELGNGIWVGPTVVTSDFLGSPIIRTHVRNASGGPLAPLLTAHLRASNGEASASIPVGMLGPGMTRAVEVRSPLTVRPLSLRWSMTLL